MHVAFLAQPHADGHDLYGFLTSVAADPAVDHLDVVVAWAKRSGLRRLRSQLEAIRDRPGTTRLIVGIDEGGATQQGLEMARELFTSVHIFHDRGSGTFHPKIYLAAGSSAARLFVGSNNLTAGGVYFNYEAAIECVLDLPADDQLLSSVRSYVERLYADTAVCHELTDALYQELISEPGYRVGDEDAGKPHPKVRAPDAPEDVDSPTDGEAASQASAFGKSAQPKRPDPLPTKKAPAQPATHGADHAGEGADQGAEGDGPGTLLGHPPPGGPTTVNVQAVVKRWFKKMSHSDAQQPKTSTANVKGCLTLGKARHPIDPKSHFRSTFFSNLKWSALSGAKGVKETADVTAEVIVDGVAMGPKVLTVDHQTSRISNQGNVPTWLHWKDFGQYLRSHNHVDDFVSLERLADGTFRVIIDTNPSGPFVDM